MIDKIKKRENELRDEFLKVWRKHYKPRDYFMMLHQDVRKSGYPDLSVHAHGKSTYWEFKHATPNFSSPGLQELNCRLLAKHSFCRYVLFVETKQHRQAILIVHPNYVYGADGQLANIPPERWEMSWASFDFEQLAFFIAKRT